MRTLETLGTQGTLVMYTDVSEYGSTLYVGMARG